MNPQVGVQLMEPNCIERLISYCTYHSRLYYLPYIFQWGAQALKNMLIVPPGSGIVHQVNLEYLARVVFNDNGTLYPDSLVGTDSHTTMINGLGVVGWGKFFYTYHMNKSEIHKNM